MLTPRLSVTIWSISLFLSPDTIAVGQQITPLSEHRDRQAIQIIRQVLSTGGGVSTLAGIQDYSASGTITCYMDGEQVQGNVTVKARGTGQFRLDASLPNGNRSVTANDGVGSSMDPDGTIRTVPRPVAVNLSSATLPLMQLVAALTDTSVSISYVGPSSYNGRAVQVVHIDKVSPSLQGSTVFPRMPTGIDFLFDSGTNMVIATRDQAFPRDGFGPGIPHEFVFSDYRAVGGVLVPFLIKDVIGGQEVTTIQLDQILFNTGLSDASFQQ